MLVNSKSKWLEAKLMPNTVGFKETVREIERYLELLPTAYWNFNGQWPTIHLAYIKSCSANVMKLGKSPPYHGRDAQKSIKL